MKAYSDTARDRAIANEVGEQAAYERTLMCTATGCPNRWTVDAGNGRLCSAHAWVSVHQWPQVTQEQQQADDARILRGPKQPPAQLTAAERAAVRQKARTCMVGFLDALRSEQQASRYWAHRLRDRERQGDSLTQAQRDMWRRALGDQAAMPGLFDPDERVVAEARTMPAGLPIPAPHVARQPVHEPDPDGRDVPIEAYDGDS